MGEVKGFEMALEKCERGSWELWEGSREFKVSSVKAVREYISILVLLTSLIAKMNR